MSDADGRRDFDWIHGEWLVRNRRLADVSDPECDEWLEFEAGSEVRPWLDGLGHVDFLDCPGTGDVPGFQAVTLRLFDPVADHWSIFWVSSRLPGDVDVPVRGGFRDGVGTFETDDVIGGVPTRIRYQWTITEPETPRWQQSFSQDAGATWRPNWQMTLSRPRDGRTHAPRP